MNPTIRTGTAEGTGAALNVNLGFVPDYVKVFNYDDADGLSPTLEWWKGMTDGHGLKNKQQAVSEGGTATYNVSNEKLTTGGISEYAGDSDNSAGFTVGTDADVNVSGETLYYIAMRNGAAG